jgi:hypothetical protein
MGLDVYLYRYLRDPEEVAAIEKEAEEFSEAAFEEVAGGRGYSQLTEEERERWRARAVAYNAERGLDEWGSLDSASEKIELPSVKYPDHMFKIGYMRSSYNASGLNGVLGSRIGRSLYDVFSEAGDNYVVKPDWERSREVAVAMLADLREHVAQVGLVQMWDVSLSREPETEGEDAVWALYGRHRDEFERRQAAAQDSPFSFTDYGSGEGDFHFSVQDGVRAAIPFVDDQGAAAVGFIIRRNGRESLLVAALPAEWQTDVVVSNEQALDLTLEEVARRQGSRTRHHVGENDAGEEASGGAVSKSSPDPLHFSAEPDGRLLALYPGRNILGRPAVYVVERPAFSEVDPRDPDAGLNHYAQALEIVIEMIDWVLGQPDRDSYRLHWSS